MTKREKKALLAQLARRQAELGWSDYELEQRSGIHRSTIMRLRDRDELPGERVLDALARALGLRLVITLEVAA